VAVFGGAAPQARPRVYTASLRLRQAVVGVTLM